MDMIYCKFCHIRIEKDSRYGWVRFAEDAGNFTPVAPDHLVAPDECEVNQDLITCDCGCDTSILEYQNHVPVTL